MKLKLIKFFKRHIGKILFLLLVSYPIYRIGWPLFDFLFVDSIKTALKDKRKIENSPYLGKEIEVAPFGKLYKMKKWSGWQDDFLHLYITDPDKKFIVSTKNISDYTTYKVFEVRNRERGFAKGNEEICLMRSSLNPDDIWSENCERILYIDEITKAYKAADIEIKTKGDTYLLFSHLPSEKRVGQTILRVNDFIAMKIDSIEELKSLFFYRGEKEYWYGSIIDINPHHLKERNVFSEQFVSNLFVMDDNLIQRDFWIFEPGTFEERLQVGQIRDDVEKWIQSHYANSLMNRLALRLVAANFKDMITKNDNYPKNSDIAKLAIEKTELSIYCASKHFKGRRPFQEHVNELTNIYFNTDVFKNKYKTIYQLAGAEVKTQYGDDSCSRISPPAIFGNAKIVEI